MARNFEKLLTDHPDMCCEVELKDYPPYLDYPKPRKPTTNADRIRQMNDEELVEWILRGPSMIHSPIGYHAVCPPGIGEDCPTRPCEQCWLDWLKKSMEE